MGVAVDEPWRDQAAVGIDDPGGGAAQVGTDGDDHAVLDRQVADVALGAGAVDDRPAADEQVVHGRTP